MNNALAQVDKLFRNFSLGFDRWEDVTQHPFFLFHSNMSNSFPFHNIYKSNDGYVIEMALAGYNKEDVQVEESDGFLTVSSCIKTKEKEDETVVQNISKRSFKRTFSVSSDFEVTNAEMQDGLLKVYLAGKKAEENKKVITIN
jgi:molecular chaperone IbpA